VIIGGVVLGENRIGDRMAVSIILSWALNVSFVSLDFHVNH